MAGTSGDQQRVGMDTAGKLKEQAEKFKTRLNSRATKLPATPTEALKVLKSIRKPHVTIFIVIAIVAIALDLLDIPETPADATVILFFVATAIEIAYFLLVRSVLNRSLAVSWGLLICLLFGLALSAIGVGLLFFIPIFLLGIVNKNAKVIRVSQEDLSGHLGILRTKTEATHRIMTGLLKARGSSPRLASALGKFTQSSVGRTVLSKFSTVSRLGIFTVLEDIPFIEWAPLHVVGLYMTYRDQKRVYAQARALIQEYESLLSQLEGMDSAIAQERFAIFIERAQALHSSRSAIAPEKERGRVPAGRPIRDIKASTGPPQRLPNRTVTPRTAPSLRDVAPTIPAAATA